MEVFKSNNPIISIIKGIIISFITTLISLTIFSILLVYSNLQEDTIKPVVITVTGISILIGSSFGTKKIQKNGLGIGAIIGTIYMLGIYIISSSVSSDFTLNLVSVIMIGVGIFGGILGGIIGVNSK